jgi:PAS domain S-box-containing protein
MKDARVLLVGITPCGDPGYRFESVTRVHEPDADGALERYDGRVDCIVCEETVPSKSVTRLAAATDCPVLHGVETDEAALEDRLNAVLGGPFTDGGVFIDRGVTETVKERAVASAPVGVTIADATREDVPLVYVNEAFERLTGYSSAEALGRNCRFLQGPGTDPEAVDCLRRAIREREAVTLELRNYRRDGSPFWNRLEIAPVSDGDGEVSHFVGFQTDVTGRREAEGRIERERGDLESLLDRVNGLLGDVTAALIEAQSRRAIERGLVTRIAASEPYVAAWVGRPDFGRRTIEPGERAGCEDLPRVGIDGDDPVARAFETDRLVVERRDGNGGHVECGAGRLAAIPLSYRGTTYGVCCVYAGEAGAFGEHERAVLRALGRVAATTINAVEGRRLLASDTVTELELRLEEPFPASIARRLGTAFTYEGAVFEDESLRTFYTVEGTTEAVLETAGREPAVVSARRVSGEDPPLFEFDVTPESLVPVLADHGSEIRSLRADTEGLVVTLDLPRGTDTREFVETVRHRFGPVELTATRESTRPTRTSQEFQADLEAGLTERQSTALRLAYVGGYFAPKRRATGNELADAMGVSRSTFHQHLRAAQRKLVADFLEPDDSGAGT